jgi:peptide/nickel transport system permease protein
MLGLTRAFAWEGIRPVNTQSQNFSFKPMLSSLGRHRLALFGLAVLVLVIFSAIFAPVLAQNDPNNIDIVIRLKPPGFVASDGRAFLLGTDSLGRDVFARIIYGSRISLSVGLSAVLIAGLLGTLLGVVAGFYGGVIDDIIMRWADIQLAFPFILLAISVLAVLGSGVDKLVLVLGISQWMQYGRLARSQTLSLREFEFVTAARAIGAGNARLILKHILPNIMSPVIVIASFSVASTIITEASLSYLGLGVPPTVPTWGAMLADGRSYIERAPWLCLYPGTAIAFTVLGVNVVGDWLRDFLDPNLKNVM